MSFIHLIYVLNYINTFYIIGVVIYLWDYLKGAKKPIVLYGMGNGADKIIKILEDRGIEYKGVFATDGFVREKYFHGLKLSSYGGLKEKFGNMIVLLSFGSARPEVLENIKRIAAEQELYAPDVPVYGEGLFTKEYAIRHKKELEYVYGRLEDELSRRTFENVVKYKISGKPEYLFNCETDVNEPYRSFLMLGKNESYLDLGAYNGDTVSDFVSRVSGYSLITAVEPDKKSFLKLKSNTEKLNDINYVNACISDRVGFEGFSMRGGRNSSLGNGGQIPAVTVDSLNHDVPFTYIKADVEGAERAALSGAEKTIGANKPKMLISCYHRTEDLFALPLAVDSIRNDYRLYLRHFPSLPAWELNYYFI